MRERDVHIARKRKKKDKFITRVFEPLGERKGGQFGKSSSNAFQWTFQNYRKITCRSF